MEGLFLRLGGGDGEVIPNITTTKNITIMYYLLEFLIGSPFQLHGPGTLDQCVTRACEFFRDFGLPANEAEVRDRLEMEYRYLADPNVVEVYLFQPEPFEAMERRWASIYGESDAFRWN